MNNETYEFDSVYQEFQPRIFRYFARLVGDDDAQDLAQETMVKVSRGLDSFRGESTLSTWIYRIATNVLRDRFKSASFKQDSAAVPLTGDVDSIEDEQVWAGERTRTIEEITIRKEVNT
jgi:RNA polymerase sigma-70 factor (ECF subfamily)